MALPATTRAALWTPGGPRCFAACVMASGSPGLFGTARGAGCQLTALLVASGDVHDASTPCSTDGAAVLPVADPGAARGVLVRAGAARPVRCHPARASAAGPVAAAAVRTAAQRPRPGGADQPAAILGTTSRAGRSDVSGRGMFTMPLGPVRSGVFESIEYLVETPGEDIPHLNIRPHYKHRGIAKRFEGLDPD